MFTRVLVAVDEASAAPALASAAMAVTRPARSAINVLSIRRPAEAEVP